MAYPKMQCGLAQRTQPSRAAFVGRLRPSSKAPSNIAQQMKPSFLQFKGCTGWIFVAYPKMHCDCAQRTQPLQTVWAGSYEGCICWPTTSQSSRDFPNLKAALDPSWSGRSQNALRPRFYSRRECGNSFCRLDPLL